MSTIVFAGTAQSKILGICKFDTVRLSFPGTPQDQAKCVLRSVKFQGNLGPVLTELPENLKATIGTSFNFSTAKLRALLAGFGIAESDIGGSIDLRLSRANNNDPAAPQARYFVIHDTSQNQVNKPFPPDDSTSLNSFEQFKAEKAAHLFNNRQTAMAGNLYSPHTFATPWRATRLERKTGVASKGLFIHVENIQPRRRNPANPHPENDNFAPDPGFTEGQYTRLALAYVVASKRAGTWMIPAFHAVLDTGIGDHDDPQNFDLEKFDSELGKLIAALSL